jgi:flagellar export protein FliJ
MERYQKEVGRLEGLRRRHAEAQIDWDARLQTGITPQEAMIYQNFFQRSRRDIEGQDEKATRAKLVVDEKRKEYVRARQGKQVLEKLKERRLAEHRVEEERVQHRQLTELGLISHSKHARAS